MTNRDSGASSGGAQAARDLTSLEYIVMGLVSLQPQSGYSIMNFFNNESMGVTASAGTIYPILKRLEKQAIIEGELETEYEARPRKVYRLSAKGEQYLDGWLREVPRVAPRYEERELAMWRFQFMEGRLSQREILQWLDNYLDMIRIYDYGQRLFQEGLLAAQEGGMSLHQQLIKEAALMDINTLRTWLELARARLLQAHLSVQSGNTAPPRPPIQPYYGEDENFDIGDLG